MAQIAFYNSVKDTSIAKTMTSFELYEYIQSDQKLKQQTEYIQTQFKQQIECNFSGYDKDQYQAEKVKRLPAAMFSGCFDRTADANGQTVEHSGLMNLDLDLDSHIELEAFWNVINDKCIPYIEAAARSVSGLINGALWINVQIEIPNQFDDVPARLVSAFKLTDENYKSVLHTAYYEMFSDILLVDAGIKSGQTKDLKRMRYISFDNEIYVNVDAERISMKNLQTWFENNQKRKDNTDITREIVGDVPSDIQGAFRLAYKFALRKAGEPRDGNFHYFITQFACCTNRMGISEKECTDYVENTILKRKLGSNAVSFPYKKYAENFGTWTDWKNTAVATSEPEAQKAPIPVKEITAQYFVPLGYSKEEEGGQKFWFYAFLSSSIITLTSAKMTEKNLLQLAPLQYWVLYYPKKGGINTNSAADTLIGQCIEKGYFDIMKLRGRGAWIDNGRVIIHTGKELIIDSKRYALGAIETEFVYEIGPFLNISADNPLKAEEGQKFTNTIGCLNWGRKELDAILLCGWLGLVPICGALKWRPHLWITGATKSGKTWVMREVVNVMVGECAYKLEGGTTESGMRELLANDALGFTYDEAEGETQKSRENLENIIGFTRSCSSSESITVKGTGGRGVKAYRPKAMVCFSSIVPQTSFGADKRRVSILRLGKAIDLELFEEIEKHYKSFCNPEFVRRFQARMINLLPSILQSISIFKGAITKQTGRTDMGDQLGAMFGAWYHIKSDSVVTQQEAEMIVGKFDLSTENGMEIVPDEVQCLQYILGSQLRVGDYQYTVGELVDIAYNSIMSEPHISAIAADGLLKRQGIKIDGNTVWLHNQSIWITSILKQTPWTKDHKSVLLRIDGAIYDPQIYFSTGTKGGAVGVPIAAVLG